MYITYGTYTVYSIYFRKVNMMKPDRTLVCIEYTRQKDEGQVKYFLIEVQPSVQTVFP